MSSLAKENFLEYYFNEQNTLITSFLNYISKNEEKLFEDTQIEKILKHYNLDLISQNDSKKYTKIDILRIIELLKTLIKESTIKNLVLILNKFHISFTFYEETMEIKIFNLFLSELSDIEKDNFLILLTKFKDKGLELIKNSFILAIESKKLLNQYNKYFDVPEEKEALKSLYKSQHGYVNYSKFYKYILKLIDKNRPLLSLHLLNKYYGFETKSDLKLAINCYINAFLSLNKVEILAKYYQTLDLAKEDIHFLQKLAEYFISIENIESLQYILSNIEIIEPNFPFLKIAKYKIERISLIKKLSIDNIDVNKIDNLTGTEFEELIKKQFEKLGFTTFSTPISGDYGADIIIENNNSTRFVIQCKRFKQKVNLKAVQEVVGALAHYNGDVGIVITNNSFLKSAINLAQSNDIELWDNFKLINFLSGNISFSQVSE